MDNAHIEAAIFQGLVFTESAHVRQKNEIYILDPHKQEFSLAPLRRILQFCGLPDR